jgi:hypothetical protein
VGFSHSYIFKLDKKKGLISASIEPCYVNGPKKFGGDHWIQALPEVTPLIVSGLENLKGLQKLRHPAVFKKVPGLIASQEIYRPKYFCVSRLTKQENQKVDVFLETLHQAPQSYQVAGLSAFNCDRFRRAARIAAGKHVSWLGRLCPWPAFRAAAIGLAARCQKFGFKPAETRHFGPDSTLRMLRRAYRKELMDKPNKWTLRERVLPMPVSRRGFDNIGRELTVAVAPVPNVHALHLPSLPLREPGGGVRASAALAA